MRAEDVTGIANKVAKRDERAQELIHKANHRKDLNIVQTNSGFATRSR